jgi:hypothetical protein
MGYIFETEIDAIITAVRARTIGEEDGITMRNLLAADIHPAIKAYFRAELEKMLATERANEQRSKRFSYSHPEVMSLQQQMDRLLILHYHFDTSEFETLLDQSVHFQFNYLCRPAFTLLNFIMANQRRVSAVEIEKKLQYIVDYRYFAELIKRYLVERGLVEVTYEEFKSLLTRIDQEVVTQHSPIELARMLRALSAFVNESRLQPHDTDDQTLLPTNAAIVFFEDKQLDGVKVRLEYERDVNVLNLISLKQLANLIERVQNVEHDVASVASIEEEYVPDTIDPSTGLRATPILEPHSMRAEPSAIDAPSELAADESDVFVGPTPGESPPGREPEPEPDFDVVIRIDDGQSPAVGSADLPDVRTFLTKAEQKKFAKLIFDRDEHAYEATMNELNALPTWQETSMFLDSLFVSLDVDPYSEPAVHLTDRLYTRFYPDQIAPA